MKANRKHLWEPRLRGVVASSSGRKAADNLQKISLLFPGHIHILEIAELSCIIFQQEEKSPLPVYSLG